MSDSIDQAATDFGWTITPKRSLSGAARSITHPDHPRISIEVATFGDARRIAARVLCDRRELTQIATAGQVVALLTDPTLIQYPTEGAKS